MKYVKQNPLESYEEIREGAKVQDLCATRTCNKICNDAGIHSFNDTRKGALTDMQREKRVVLQNEIEGVKGNMVRSPRLKSPRDTKLDMGSVERVMGARLEGRTIAQQHAIVRNVSERGMCVSIGGLPPFTGDTIGVTLPSGLQLEGEVRWVNDSMFGLYLSDRLDLRQLELATQRRNAPLAEAIDWRVGEQLGARPVERSSMRRI